jgi:hypothetical protein
MNFTIPWQGDALVFGVQLACCGNLINRIISGNPARIEVLRAGKLRGIDFPLQRVACANALP